jgi:NodT family efflux transporter outer membrane factor (OMF) lipoprotein
MKSRIDRLAIAGLLLLLCACNPAPKYARPPAPTPSAFKETLPPGYKEGAGWKLAEPGDDKIRAKWWEMYNDAQLNALEEQVSISNQTIAAAEANFRAARALVVSGRAALFPTLSAAPSYANSRTSATARSSRAPITTTLNTFSMPLDLSYTVDFWHRIRNTLAANTYSAQASAADVATALLSTQAELATIYLQLRAVDMQRRILTETLANYRQALDLTTTLYKTGINSEQEVSQAQTQVNVATAQTTDLGVARTQYEHAIATLIGKPASSFTLDAAPFAVNPPTIPVAVPSALLERRPDVAALERQVETANALIGVARAAYYPNLTLSATAGFQTSDFTQWFTWPSRFWSVGPTLSQTLFDAGARRALNAQAQAQYDAAVANYRETVLTSFQAVEDQLAALRILSQEAAEQQAAVASSTRYLDLANTRFRTGVDSYLNVVAAQTSLLNNRQVEVEVQLRQMTASVALILALGGGWDNSQLPQMKNFVSHSTSPSSGP